MKVIADTLGLSRSNLVEQLGGATKRRGNIIVARTTYGYYRITALLNRARLASDADCQPQTRFPPHEPRRASTSAHVGYRPV
jgi:hypothetical protein